MDQSSGRNIETRFAAYVEGLSSVLGHADRIGPLRDYCTGLILPGERKSVEPMAAKTAPGRTAAQHQSLLHFVGIATWSDEKVLAKVREMVLPLMQRQEPIQAWIIDDTGFPKQGTHSVGVQHQYCGQLGKEANCQVAVSLSIANHSASLPVAWRLYLPKEWIKDKARRKKAGVPRDVSFKTKPEIALDQIRWACEAGLPRGVALMDAVYGIDSRFRAEAKRQTAEQYRASRRARSDLGQMPGSRSAQGCLADDTVAGGFGRVVVVALCPHPRSGRTQPAQAGIAGGGVVADRVARG
jgi:SRSO17 transposase